MNGSDDTIPLESTSLKLAAFPFGLLLGIQEWEGTPDKWPELPLSLALTHKQLIQGQGHIVCQL